MNKLHNEVLTWGSFMSLDLPQAHILKIPKIPNK